MSVHTSFNQAMGAAESVKLPILRPGCEIEFGPHPARFGRLGYRVLFSGKPIAEPVKSFRSRRELFRHAAATIDDLFSVFNTVTLTSGRPRLRVVDGGQARRRAA